MTTLKSSQKITRNNNKVGLRTITSTIRIQKQNTDPTQWYQPNSTSSPVTISRTGWQESAAIIILNYSSCKFNNTSNQCCRLSICFSFSATCHSKHNISKATNNKNKMSNRIQSQKPTKTGSV